MIPRNRPVLVADIEGLRQTFGLITAEMIGVLKMSITKWSSMLRGEYSLDPNTLEKLPKDKTVSKGEAFKRVVSHPGMALLIRLLDSDPTFNPLPGKPDVQAQLDLYNSYLPDDKKLDQKRFAVVHGFEASAGYRWFDGKPVSPVAAQIMFFMRLRLERMTPPERRKFMLWWIETVEAEASARKVADVMRAATWAHDVANQKLSKD